MASVGRCPTRYVLNFGSHNTNQEIHLPVVEQPDNLIYLTYFNTGLQGQDIKDLGPDKPEPTAR